VERLMFRVSLQAGAAGRIMDLRQIDVTSLARDLQVRRYLPQVLSERFLVLRAIRRCVVQRSGTDCINSSIVPRATGRAQGRAHFR
jgi:hypothetical protein